MSPMEINKWELSSEKLIFEKGSSLTDFTVYVELS